MQVPAHILARCHDDRNWLFVVDTNRAVEAAVVSAGNRNKSRIGSLKQPDGYDFEYIRVEFASIELVANSALEIIH